MNTRFRSISSFLGVAALGMCLVVGPGCAGPGAAIVPEVSNAATKKLVVFPVRGQPVSVMWQHDSTFVLGGLVGAAIEAGASASHRSGMIERLNRDAADFEPTRVLAEECVKLLRDSSEVKFQSVELSAETLDLPGASALWAQETRPFKGLEHHNKWLRLSCNWHRAKSPAPSADVLKQASDSLALEVTFVWSWLNHSDELQLVPMMVLRDPSNGEVVGRSGLMEVPKTHISPVTEDSDLRQFEHDFRLAANNAALQALRRMKLLWGSRLSM